MKYSFSSLEDIWKGLESKKWKFIKIPIIAPSLRENKEMFLAEGGGGQLFGQFGYKKYHIFLGSIDERHITYKYMVFRSGQFLNYYLLRIR